MPGRNLFKTGGANPCGGESKCDPDTEEKPLGCADWHEKFIHTHRLPMFTSNCDGSVCFNKDIKKL